MDTDEHFVPPAEDRSGRRAVGDRVRVRRAAPTLLAATGSARAAARSAVRGARHGVRPSRRHAARSVLRGTRRAHPALRGGRGAAARVPGRRRAMARSSVGAGGALVCGRSRSTSGSETGSSPSSAQGTRPPTVARRGGRHGTGRRRRRGRGGSAARAASFAAPELVRVRLAGVDLDVGPVSRVARARGASRGVGAFAGCCCGHPVRNTTGVQARPRSTLPNRVGMEADRRTQSCSLYDAGWP